VVTTSSIIDILWNSIQEINLEGKQGGENMEYVKKPWLKFYDPRIGEDVSVNYDSLFNLNASKRTGKS
jgi:hypothetical protein